MIGRTISHYKILEKLGGGGMGIVYKAQDLKLDRFVALKFLPTYLSTNELEKQRFIHEAKAASALDHPNICNIHEIDETEDGQLFIIMGYYDGETLKKRIESRPLKIEEAIEIAIQVAEGLQKAHQKGIIHRDIKPANIFITEDGIVKILDFGLAKLAGQSKLTKASSTLGTIYYMSPEQTRGGDVDHRSDIWSFGVVLYEMLSGTLPFKGDYDQAIVYSIFNEEPESLKSMQPDIPNEIEIIINKALTKDREERYQQISEIEKELSDLHKKMESERLKQKVSKKEYIPSIAVLPFVNMSAEPEQEYFCEGMAEELINALTQMSGLRVVSRTSAFQFKEKGYNIHKVGKELNVKTILEGSVRKAGNRIRITAQLVNTEDGYHLWSEKFDRDMEDIFAIQDEISLKIVEKLKIELLGEEKKALLKRYTENVKAYNLYLKGRFFWNQRYKGTLPQALEHFEKAINIDPSYALAYAGVADCYNVIGIYHFMPPKAPYSKAKAAIKKALELDENLAEGYTSLGLLKFIYDWDWLESERAFKRAIELNPKYGLAHCYYSLFLAVMGRFTEAKIEAEKAQELEPLSIIINAVNGYTFILSRQYNKAIVEIKKALDIDPNSIIALFFIAYAYILKSKYADAIKFSQKAVSLVEGSTFWLAGLGMVYGMSGKKDKARKVIEELNQKSKTQYVAAIQSAWIYSSLDEKNKAFEWLNKAFDEHDISLYDLKSNPIYDTLRGDPRFDELLKKIGFEP